MIVRALLLSASLAACAGMAACASQPRPRPGERAGPASVGSPFAPDRMSLHPLTRIDRDPEGLPMIVVYLDIRDRWDDPTKAIGTLQVQLYRPAGGPVSAMDEQQLTWDLDLSDLDHNSRLYDPVTHMYRLPLLEAPEWVIPDAGGDTPRMRIRAILNTFGPAGEPRQLEDDLLMGA